MTGFRSAPILAMRFIQSGVAGQVCDVETSVHDPYTDLLLPDLEPFGEWLADRSDEQLAAIIGAQAQEQTEKAVRATRGNPAASAPKVPDLGELKEALRAAQPARLLQMNAIARSVALFKALRQSFFDADVPGGLLDLRPPWLVPHNRGTTVSIVGSTVADLIHTQAGRPFDPPSARYLAQASHEVDGDPRPTTMIAAAGTSLRAVLAVARDHGHATELELPSASNRPFFGEVDAFYRAVNGRKADAVVNLNRDSKNLLAWLISGRPAAVIMKAGLRFLSAEAPDFVIAPESASAQTFKHPLLVLGFRLVAEQPRNTVTWRQFLEARGNDDDLPLQYRVRNSGNAQWGEGGFAWLPHRLLLDQGKEAYGLSAPVLGDDLQ
jgi:hypothetical protein